MIWDIFKLETPIIAYSAGAIINSIQFNPKSQWIAVGTDLGVRIWDIASTDKKPIQEIVEENAKKNKKAKNQMLAKCLTICWNALGTRLFAGFNDSLIRVYENKKKGM